MSVFIRANKKTSSQQYFALKLYSFKHSLYPLYLTCQHSDFEKYYCFLNHYFFTLFFFLSYPTYSNCVPLCSYIHVITAGAPRLFHTFAVMFHRLYYSWLRFSQGSTQCDSYSVFMRKKYTELWKNSIVSVISRQTCIAYEYNTSYLKRMVACDDEPPFNVLLWFQNVYIRSFKSYFWNDSLFATCLGLKEN